MATARNIHPEDDLVPNPYPISITATGASPAACIILNNQPVTFTNNTTSPITIMFEPDALLGWAIFTNIIALAPGASNTQTPLISDRTVNYSIDGSTTNYPYAIQVGAGPFYVTVNGAFCSPDPAVIPLNGTLTMVSTDGKNYTIHWNASNGDPFTPLLTNVYALNNPLTVPHTERTPAGPYSYTVQVGNMLGQGGGKVKVTSG